MRQGSSSAFLILALALAAPVAARAPHAWAQGAVADHMTPSREFDQERLGAAGLQKCAAFKRVRRDSDEMQAADHGQLTPGDTRRLSAELAHAKRLAPRHVTPADCGVPL